MARKKLPDLGYLRQRLQPDFKQGLLYWLPLTEDLVTGTAAQSAKAIAAIWNGKFEGKIAGTLSPMGYIHVWLPRRQYAAHRILWKMYTGEEPPEILDHINRQRADNRIENLRAADSQSNMRNRSAMSGTGVVGVSFKHDRYLATIRVKKRLIYLGRHATLERAIEARRSAELEYWGANMGHLPSPADSAR